MNVDEMLERIAEMREAKDQRPRTVRILDAVLEIVDRGRDHLRAWEGIREVVHKQASLADLSPSFFVLTGIAHIEAATLHAAKLVDKQADSINITYLLNTIEADRNQALFRSGWLEIKRTLESARQHLQEIESIVRRIKEKRDRDLAHLDRRHINASQDQQAIEVEDLRGVFDAVDEIGRELAASNAAFAECSRFSLDGLFGSQGLNDLIYFASAGFHDERVKSPNPRVEGIRKFDRNLRRVGYEELITVEPDKRGGQPCIRGLRITVYDVLSYLASGMTEDEIISDYPDLTHEDILASLSYAADRERKTAVSHA